MKTSLIGATLINDTLISVTYSDYLERFIINRFEVMNDYSGDILSNKTLFEKMIMMIDIRGEYAVMYGDFIVRNVFDDAFIFYINNKKRTENLTELLSY